jgi:hypothetical protein
MKKLFILAVSMSLAMSAATAQTTSTTQTKTTKTATAGPEISFAEKSHDFGKINQGDVVEYTFKFKNTGTQPLVISNVGVTCGCTATDWPKEPIAPGKSSAITAKFNSAGKMGAQNKVITVESNSVGGPAQVSIISEVMEKPAAGADVMKPAAAPSAAAPAANSKVKSADSKVKTSNSKTKTKSKK